AAAQEAAPTFATISTRPDSGPPVTRSPSTIARRASGLSSRKAGAGTIRLPSASKAATAERISSPARSVAHGGERRQKRASTAPGPTQTPPTQAWPSSHSSAAEQETGMQAPWSQTQPKPSQPGAASQSAVAPQALRQQPSKQLAPGPQSVDWRQLENPPGSHRPRRSGSLRISRFSSQPRVAATTTARAIPRRPTTPPPAPIEIS